ncbi:MAG: class I SAM-dependent methyltransferase [Pseudomonadota bacterium]
MTSTDPNALMAEHVLAHIPCAGARVLDVGCGGGFLVRALRKAGHNPTGLETSRAALDAARKADPDHGHDYADGVGETMPFEDALFDAVIFCQSLHHVPTSMIGEALGEARRVLNEHGRLIVLEPVADGDLFPLERLIDDETVVRAAAQLALKVSADGMFSHVSHERFDTHYVYENAPTSQDWPDWFPESWPIGLRQFIGEMVAVSAERTAAAKANLDALLPVWEQNGEELVGGAKRFRQPNVLDVLG